MQKTTNRIARRITLAFLLYGIALTLVLGLSLVAVFKSVEESMLDDILYDELKHFRLEADRVQSFGFFRSRTTSIYAAPLDDISDIPIHVRDFPEGIHDLIFKNRDYRVLVEHIGETHYIVKFDDTKIHEREREFVRLVLLSSTIVLMIALFIGWRTSHQIIRPIKQLVNQVIAFRNKPDESLDLSAFNNDEIGVLAHELQDYHDQLKNLLIREKEFAGNVSHELRTPVTSISLAAEVMALKVDLSPIERQRIQRIQRAVGEMSELIDTFLVLAQVNNKSTKHDYAACELGPIVRKVVEQQRIWLGDKPLEVIIDESEQLTVLAPPGIPSVLVANLVRNAFRYTERGTVTVSIKSNKLMVIDTGIGIDESMQARIFKREAMDDSDNIDRVRLGLSIVQRICERYGWTVSFESKKGQGTQFTVVFTA